MADASTRSAATVEAPLEFKHTFELTVTLRALELAPVGDCVKSDTFEGGGHIWYLRVHLGGIRDEVKEFVSIYLMHEGSRKGPSIAVNATLEACGESSTADGVIERGQGWGWTSISSKANVAAWLKGHGGRMEVAITVRLAGKLSATSVPVAPGAPAPLPVPPPVLSGQLRALLASGSGADCTLVCGSERIPAHSLVLSLRSGVFRAQLDRSSPLACPNLAAVPVPTEIEPPILRKLLEHVYGDEDVEFSSVEEAQHLLNAADHYGIDRLRSMCERHLASHLTVENAAFTLTLADQHSASALREAAEAFIAAHVAEVVETVGWGHLSQSRPLLAQAVLITAATGGKKRGRGATADRGAAAEGSAEGAGGSKRARASA